VTKEYLRARRALRDEFDKQADELWLDFMRDRISHEEYRARFNRLESELRYVQAKVVRP
jgi:hypothetical protein